MPRDGLTSRPGSETSSASRVASIAFLKRERAAGVADSVALEGKGRDGVGTESAEYCSHRDAQLECAVAGGGGQAEGAHEATDGEHQGHSVGDHREGNRET
jgi:hypothetical protein